MNQSGHIFAKDARHLRWEIGIMLVLTAAWTWTYPYDFMPDWWTSSRTANPEALRNVGAFLTLLVPVSWWVLITRLVHDENLVGDKQWWITKPYMWGELLGAKVLFLAAFICVPLAAAQCVLLETGGFRPFADLPGLVTNLILLAGLVVIPLMSLAAVTASFGRMTLTLLGLLVAMIAGIAVLAWIGPGGGFGVPAAAVFSFAVIAGGCGAVVVLQYARRMVWQARVALAVAAALFVGGAVVSGSSAVVHMTYPRGSALQLTYDTATHYNSFSTQSGNKEVGIPAPVTVAGIAPDTVAILDAAQVTAEAADGRQWSGGWTPISGARYDATSEHEMLPLQVGRSFYEAEYKRLVTLHLRFAVSTVRVVHRFPTTLPEREFAVPDFGICAPVMSGDGLRYTDLACRAAFRDPPLTRITVQWSDESCGTNTAETKQVTGEGWAGSTSSVPADFGLSSVVGVGFGLSNGTKTDAHGNQGGPRRLCPGSPISFTRYALVGRSEYDVTFTNFRMMAMQGQGTSVGGVGVTF